MEIKQILASEINSNLLDNFNFYNKVTKVWRKKENDWVLEDISYIRNWDNSKKRWGINYFLSCLNQGGILLGAFDRSNLVSFTLIDGKLYGSKNQYANLRFNHVSYEYRGKGLGSQLFIESCKKAVYLGAKKIYISAHSSNQSIAFYNKMGCEDAQEIIQECIDTPYDWQLEYRLY